MIKTLSILFLSTLLSVPVCRAQFTGTYSLRDGGVDMPSSQLTIFPDHEFAISYYAGVITGTWEQKGNTKLILKERRPNEHPFTVYVGTNPQQEQKIRFSFTYFDTSDALISLSKDTLQQSLFQPVFDEHSFYGDYSITRDKGINYLKLACDPDRKTSEERYQTEDPETTKTRQKPSGKALIYTFPLPAEFNAYYIIFDENALTKLRTFGMEKKGSKYLVDGKETGEQDELTAKTIREFKKYKENIEKARTTKSLGRYRDIPSGTSMLSPLSIKITALKENTEKALFPPKK